MMLRAFVFALIFFGNSHAMMAQSDASSFSRADSLRGLLSEARSCYDVQHYDLSLKFLDVRPIPKNVHGEGREVIGKVTFRALNKSIYNRLQFDLFASLTIDSIIFNGVNLRFEREENAVFVLFNEWQRPDQLITFSVHYHGPLPIAQRPPWDGGFVFSADKEGHPWVGVACEGFGASSWWPNKDHLSDEPDAGVRLSITIPQIDGLMAVGNGQLSGIEQDSLWKTFVWEVKHPINNYNVTVNIAKYDTIQQAYIDVEGENRLMTHYVLAKNREKAVNHFAQIIPMLMHFEALFGVYPFWEDGYKLVETPYWGMEHQSAVAYGNGYKNNSFGFDFIIVHESAHEWWGNGLSVGDHADMWIHEGFTTYAETLLLERTRSKADAIQYFLGQRKRILSKQPIVGPYDVNYIDNDTDVYFKAAWMIHTFRNSIGNDAMFFQMLREFYEAFKYSTTSTDAVLKFWLDRMGYEYQPAWHHYLHEVNLPVLVWRPVGKDKQSEWEVRFENVAPGFALPLRLANQVIAPSTDWQVVKFNPSDALIQEIKQNYLIEVVSR